MPRRDLKRQVSVKFSGDFSSEKPFEVRSISFFLPNPRCLIYCIVNIHSQTIRPQKCPQSQIRIRSSASCECAPVVYGVGDEARSEEVRGRIRPALRSFVQCAPSCCVVTVYYASVLARGELEGQAFLARSVFFVQATPTPGTSAVGSAVRASRDTT